MVREQAITDIPRFLYEGLFPTTPIVGWMQLNYDSLEQSYILLLWGGMRVEDDGGGLFGLQVGSPDFAGSTNGAISEKWAPGIFVFHAMRSTHRADSLVRDANVRMGLKLKPPIYDDDPGYKLLVRTQFTKLSKYNTAEELRNWATSSIREKAAAMELEKPPPFLLPTPDQPNRDRNVSKVSLPVSLLDSFPRDQEWHNGWGYVVQKTPSVEPYVSVFLGKLTDTFYVLLIGDTSFVPEKTSENVEFWEWEPGIYIKCSWIR